MKELKTESSSGNLEYENLLSEFENELGKLEFDALEVADTPKDKIISVGKKCLDTDKGTNINKVIGRGISGKLKVFNTRDGIFIVHVVPDKHMGNAPLSMTIRKLKSKNKIPNARQVYPDNSKSGDFNSFGNKTLSEGYVQFKYDYDEEKYSIINKKFEGYINSIESYLE